jgi:Domain of unknown function (DUF5666)
MQRSLRLRTTVAAVAIATAALAGVAFIAGPIAGAATRSGPRSRPVNWRHLRLVDRARIDTIGASSFTVLTGRRDLTVNVLPSTIFRVDGQSGVYGDLAVDEEVRIFGTNDGTGTVNASLVDVLPSAKVVAWGTVQSIGTSSFALWRLRGGIWTVDFTGSTKFLYAANQSSPNGVFATRTTTAGTLNALAVVILTKTLVHESGYITSIGTNSFTILHDGSTVTVDVGDATKYHIAGFPKADFGDLAVGDPVAIGGAATATPGTVHAAIVTVITKRAHAIYGEVSSVGTGEFTVVHRQANLNVDVTANTQFFVLTGPGSFSDLSTGERVLMSVNYTRIAGTVDANWVLIFQSKVVPLTSNS